MDPTEPVNSQDSLGRCDAESLMQAIVGIVKSDHEARWIFSQVTGFNYYEAMSLRVAIERSWLERAMEAANGRAAGLPLQYAIGVWPFRNLQLRVNPAVLIPRPETEVLVDEAVGWIRSKGASPKPVVVFDLGTGSGAIALSVASEVELSRVFASDRSAKALDVAAQNLAGLDESTRSRVTLLQGDWFEATDPLGVSPDLIISNPPYISRHDYLGLDPLVREYEPESALLAGDVGTEQLFRIVEGGPSRLAPDGVMMLELSPEQVKSVSDRAREVGFLAVRVVADLAGRERVLVLGRAS